MRLILPMPGNEAMAQAIAQRTHVELGAIEVRHFPDGESYVRLMRDVAGRDVDIVCTLARPDPQFLSLIYAAGAARDLGARRVSLIAPYLAYMRQDARFKEGEAISSVHFASIVSQFFDSLVTVDPHLHRRNSLDELFTIPARAVHAAPLLADWIGRNVPHPLVVGPDRESEQWVTAVAQAAGAPHVVLAKQRLGDRHVVIETPDILQWRELTPVLIDDIASSGGTLIEAARNLRNQGFVKPHCVVVHALLGDEDYARLLSEVAGLVSTDTAPHPSNAISVAELLA